MKIIICLFILTSYVYGSFAPPSFVNDHKKMTFVDIINADYNFQFIDNKLLVKSHLKFIALDDGLPLIDIVPRAYTVINSELKELPIVELPSLDSHPMKFIPYDKPLKKGFIYEVQINHEIKSNYTNYDDLDFMFKFCDGLGIRKLLEQYVPTNLQFDQYRMSFQFTLPKSINSYQIVANGQIKKTSYHSIIINMPLNYNSASPYLHIFTKGKYPLMKKNVNNVQVTLYLNKINRVRSFEKWFKVIQSYFNKLKKLYGTFPHHKMIIYLGENFSGIEHAGATRTSYYSLFHELLHMYFGRGAMPADGRSAWIDEGIARWDQGGSYKDIGRRIPYRQYKELPQKFIGLTEQSSYMRTTFNYAKIIGQKFSLISFEKKPIFSADPYEQGAIFMGYLDHITSGGLVNFLSFFAKKYHFKLYTQDIFFNELRLYFPNLQEDILNLEEKYFFYY